MNLPQKKEKLKKLLKDKTILLANWGCGDKNTFQCRDWIPLFKEFFKRVIVFSLRNHYYFYGKKQLNQTFLKIIKKEKPDYLIFGHRYDEIETDTLMKIKKISPNTKTIIEFGDDDSRFDNWGRFYCLFFDYVMTGKIDTSIYKKDNYNNAFCAVGISTNFYKSLNIKKIYDVSFIGRPSADRYNYLKFLLDNDVNIKLFGVGWNNYPDLKKVYGGILYDEDFVKMINQTKINLNFSKIFYEKEKSGELKGRLLEIPACKSFLLTEYTDKNIDFINKRPEFNFKTKEELIEKIIYYLKNEEEREKLAEEAYKHVINNWTWDLFFINFFLKTEKDKIKKTSLPKFNKKIIQLSKKDIEIPLKNLKEKIFSADYISFFKDNTKSSPYRNYFQSYSLFISGKQISCCDYCIYSDSIGDYLLFRSKHAFNTLNKKDFHELLNINQLIVIKDYFIKNIDSFKRLFNNKPAEILTEKNTVFVSIPLVKIRELPSISYKKMGDIFYMLFSDKVSPLLFQKKILEPYFFKLLIFALSGHSFMIRHLIERYYSGFNKNTLNNFRVRYKAYNPYNP